MSIATAADALRRFLAGAPAAPLKVSGLAVRPCLTPGMAEAVIRFSDGSHQILTLSPQHSANLTVDLATITAAGIKRR